MKPKTFQKIFDMDKYETPKWNLLIDCFLKGDEMPFFTQLKFITIHHHFFRGKSLFEIKQQYDTEPEDYFQERFLEILRLDYLRRWKNELLSDELIDKEIRGFIRNRLIDKVRAKRLTSEGIDISLFPLMIEKDESEVLNNIKKRLNQRQLFIFENYHKFQLGDDDVQSLAKRLGLNKKTVEPEIKKIKQIIKEEFLQNSPHLEKYLNEKRGIYESVQ